MKITIEPTPALTEVCGVLCRLWKGTTESGGRLEVYVAFLAVPYVACLAVPDASPRDEAAFAAISRSIAAPGECVVPAWVLSPVVPAGTQAPSHPPGAAEERRGGAPAYHRGGGP